MLGANTVSLQLSASMHSLDIIDFVDDVCLVDRGFSNISILTDNEGEDTSCDVLLTKWAEALLAASVDEVPQGSVARYELEKRNRSCEPANVLAWLSQYQWPFQFGSLSSYIGHKTCKSICGKVSLSGSLGEPAVPVPDAVQGALADVLESAVGSGINVSVSIHNRTNDFKEKLLVDPKLGCRCTFMIALDDPNDADAVLELLRLESEYAGARRLMPMLIEIFDAATHLALRLEVTSPHIRTDNLL